MTAPRPTRSRRPLRPAGDRARGPRTGGAAPHPGTAPAPDPHADTIVAISTPPGRGGIGVVRLSGPRSREIAGALFRPAPRAASRNGAERLRFGRIIRPGGEPLDHGYLVTFDGDHAFTREDSAEIWAHGSPAVLTAIVQEAMAKGARPASPGEFTMRAFLNGRIDATQAEGLRDLIEARTLAQARIAHTQVMGRIGREVDALKDRLADVAARLEAALEFAEEPEVGSGDGLAARVAAIRGGIESLAATHARGRLLRDGILAPIIGLPNAGKSSVFNALLRDDRAIVTPVAGTTRDVLEEDLDVTGIPVRLADTAGLRAPGDAPGDEAVRRARGVAAMGDLLLIVLDRSRPLAGEEDALLGSTSGRPRIVILNKCDLPDASGGAARRLVDDCGALEVSARTGEGIAALRARLASHLASDAAPVAEEAIITSLRQRDLLLKAAASLRRAEESAVSGADVECWIVDLRDGLDRLGEITGAVSLDDLYDKIFSTFCIGK